MIVAAGGGERDYAVDAAILSGLPQGAPIPSAYLNEHLLARPAADPVPGAAVQPAGRQHLHRARRDRLVAHLHGRGSRRRRRACASPARGSPRARATCSWSAARTTRSGRTCCCTTRWAACCGRGAVRRRSGRARRRGGGMVAGLGRLLPGDRKPRPCRRRAARRRSRASPAMPHRPLRAASPAQATANAARQLGAMARRSIRPRRAVISGASGAAAPTQEEARLPRRARPAGARRRRPRCGHSLEPSFPASLALAAMASRAAGCSRRWSRPRRRWTAPLRQVLVTVLGSLARRGARPGDGQLRRSRMTPGYRPSRPPRRRRHRHRRLTSLGQGQADNWAALTAGRVRHPPHHPLPDRPACAPPSPARSISSRSTEPSAPALSRAPGRTGRSRKPSPRPAIGTTGDFPGPLFLALPPVEMEWPQRLALAAASGANDDGRLRRPDARRRRPASSSRFYRALPVRLGGREPGRPLRHQGLADRDLDRLRLGRHRDPARRRGDPPRRVPRRRCASAPMPRSTRRA